MQTRTGVTGMVGLLVLALLGGVVATAQPVPTGETFRNFDSKDMLTGKKISLKQLRGKVVLIDFWATWCGPCRKAIPGIKKIHREYHQKGLEIISISSDRDAEMCKRFVKRENMTWHHILDKRGSLGTRFGVKVIPTMYVVGRDGKVILMAVGANEEGEKALEKAIKEGLAQVYEGATDGDEEGPDDVELEALSALDEADALRADGRYAEALKLYEEIGLKYAGRETAKDADKRARNLREDPEVQKAMKEDSGKKKLDKDAAAEVDKWLKIARKMAKAKNYSLAKRYYQKVIDKYPDSAGAEKAKKGIEKLPK